MRERVVNELRVARLRDLNSSRGSEGLASLNTGKTLDQLASETNLEIEDLGFIKRQQSEIDSAIRQRAFRMAKPEEGVVYDGLSLGNGDYLIVELSAVLSNDSDVDQKALEAFLEANSSSEYLAARKMLTTRAEVFRTPLEDI